MPVSQEIRNYFSKLIELLTTDTYLTEFFEKIKEEIVQKSKTQFEEWNNKIIELKSRVVAQENILKKMWWQQIIQPTILFLY